MMRLLRWGGIALALLLIAGMVAPYIRVDQYREQIRAGLQRSLQRKVDIYGDTRLNLFRGPGFSIGKVVIHDDPSIGLEPLANVLELQTTVSLRSLWTGRLEFATVRFVEPSFNITKGERGPWNVVPLLQSAMAIRGTQFPEIQISDGRINFKLDNTKSILYLTDTDLTISPSREGFEVSFSCAPARTDRRAGGYGSFTGRGRYTNGQLDVDVELEKSPIEELLTFARGQSLGLHGVIASKAKVTGPVSRPRMKGRVELSDVHRWDLAGGSTAAWTISYRGGFDAAEQRFELVADSQNNPKSPVALKLSVSQLLTQPDWRAEAGIDGLPAAALLEFARHMGTPLPDGFKLDGRAVGTIAYGSAAGMQGEIRIMDAAVQVSDGPQFRTPEASLVLAGDEVRLLPAELAGKENAARLQATYAPFRQKLTAELTGRGLRISDLQTGEGRLLNGVHVPVLAHFRGGTWSGTLQYAGDSSGPAAWDAALQVRDTAAAVPGIAVPVKIATADVQVQGERLDVRRMRAVVGTVEVFGDYSWVPGEERPDRFALTIPAADIESIERVLLPTLQRTSGFFARTLRLRTATPDWLRERRAEGRLRVGTLTAGDIEMRGIRTRVLWTGTTVQFPDLQVKLEEGSATGRLVADLSQPEPQYKLTGVVQNLRSKFDLAGDMTTAGIGLALLANVRADGTFEARSLPTAPESFGTVSGAFDFSMARTGPQLRLSGVQAAMGSEHFNGEGGTQADGRLQVDLASQTRTVRLHGPMAALKLEVTSDGTKR